MVKAAGYNFALPRINGHSPTRSVQGCDRESIDVTRYVMLLLGQISKSEQAVNALTKLLKRLDLPRSAPNEFIGGAGIGGVTGEARLFGGLVLAQAAVAAARTVDHLQMHSLHALFLRPGRAEKDIRYQVTSVKEGRNFHVRLITAKQDEQIIFQMHASFGHFKAAVEHQDSMRPVGPPESYPNRDELRGRNPDTMPIEIRMIDGLEGEQPTAPTTAIWMRPRGDMPNDPVLHLATLVYATDRVFLGTAWRPHVHQGPQSGASLDHSLWFHDPIRFDDWLLFEMHSPAARFERALVQGALYTTKGRRVGSVTQEGMMTFSRSHPQQTH